MRHLRSSNNGWKDRGRQINITETAESIYHKKGKLLKAKLLGLIAIRLAMRIHVARKSSVSKENTSCQIS